MIEALPAITGRPPYSRDERTLLALPIKLCGLGLMDPISMANHEREAIVSSRHHPTKSGL